jgi:hypothetical protein
VDGRGHGSLAMCFSTSGIVFNRRFVQDPMVHRKVLQALANWV